jgi:hypothetical protein
MGNARIAELMITGLHGGICRKHSPFLFFRYCRVQVYSIGNCFRLIVVLSGLFYRENDNFFLWKGSVRQWFTLHNLVVER